MARGHLAELGKQTASEKKRQANQRNAALRVGFTLHTILTPQGRRWLLVSVPRDGEDYEQIERIHMRSLMFSLDEVEDTIRELSAE